MVQQEDKAEVINGELISASERVLELLEELCEPTRKTSAGYMRAIVTNGETFRYFRSALAKAKSARGAS